MNPARTQRRTINRLPLKAPTPLPCSCRYRQPELLYRATDSPQHASQPASKRLRTFSTHTSACSPFTENTPLQSHNQPAVDRGKTRRRHRQQGRRAFRILYKRKNSLASDRTNFIKVTIPSFRLGLGKAEQLISGGTVIEKLFFKLRPSATLGPLRSRQDSVPSCQAGKQRIGCC
jgi:hypothetical protein